MSVKYLVFVLFQLSNLVNPEAPTTVQTILPEEFEQILSDFIFQYHFAKYGTGNATDICETPTKYINEDFIDSELYNKFQLQKYLAIDSKICQNLCLNANYEIVENDSDHVTTIIPVPTISDNAINGTVTNGTVTDTTSTEPASTENASPEPASTQNASPEPASTENASPEPASTENTSTEPASTENASTNTTSTDIAINTEGIEIDETTTVGSEGTNETVENRNSIGTESGKQTQEKEPSGDKKTAVIVAATVMAVGTAAAAFVPVVNWVKALLQSGTYVFPGSPNV